jgi:RNA-directed DNA polymerase
MTKVNSPREKVRALQRALYVAAKQNGERKFPALFDRIALPDVLQVAWEQVRRNKGAAGIDGETLKAVEAYGVERMLEELSMSRGNPAEVIARNPAKGIVRNQHL